MTQKLPPVWRASAVVSLNYALGFRAYGYGETAAVADANLEARLSRMSEENRSVRILRREVTTLRFP